MAWQLPSAQSPVPAALSSSSAASSRYSALRVSVSNCRACVAWLSVPALRTWYAAIATCPTRVRFDIGTALVGELIGPAAALCGFGPDQPLVLELLQCRVDGSRAGPPHAVASLADRLDDLVTVHRLLGQQRERRSADVAPLGPRPARPASAGLGEPGAERRSTRAGWDRRSAGEAPSAAMTATAAPPPPEVLVVASSRPAFISHRFLLFCIPAPVSLRSIPDCRRAV